jgi:phenylpyruvate tautomerase PptA (4-oxalocrotonate tautomerase family)
VTQIKIYGRDDWLPAARIPISRAIQAAVVDALEYPADKWVHRFFPMSDEDFVWGLERSGQYTLIEIAMFEGRTPAAKAALLRGLFTRLRDEVGLDPHDIEIAITETPRSNWGIRGLPADELTLGYRVEV